MKRKLFLLGAILFSALTGWAQTSPYTGVAPENIGTGKSYYLYNVDKGTWLGDNDRNTAYGWTSHAELGARGRDIKFIENGDGWQLDPKMGNNHSINAVGLYMDTNRRISKWTVTSFDYGTVVNAVKISGEVAWDSETDIRTGSLAANQWGDMDEKSTINNVWQIVTREERLAKMQPDDDISWVVLGGTFPVADEHRDNSWQGKKGSTFNDGHNDDNNRQYNRVWELFTDNDPREVDVYQDINLPNGKYIVKAQVLTVRGGRDASKGGFETYGTSVNGVVYANANTTPMKSVYECTSNRSIDRQNTLDLGNGTWVPGNFRDASYYFFYQNEGWVNDIEVEVLDNHLRVGFRLNSPCKDAIWVDNFSVIFKEAHVHNYVNGICACNEEGRFETPAQDNGYYLLDNPGKVEWFSAQVAKNGGSTVYNAKLTADIDFEGIDHTPIGSSEQQKFQGEFDGQGHRISNLVINKDEENIGFFGWIRGANDVTIKNMVIDSSCSFTGSNKVGAFVGTYQVGGGKITLENIVNEANVTGRQDVAAFIGSEHGGDVTFTFRNLVNKGTITATDANPYAGALCCYLRTTGQSKIENFVNLGKIIGHKGGNIGRHNIGTRKNIVDLSDTNMSETTNGQNHGLDSGLTKDDMASGKLAYYLNSNDDQANDAFFQTIGTDAYPVPFSSSKRVFLNGSYENVADNVTLDENNTFGTTQNFNANVTINRTMKAEKWNTFCVPVDMTIPSGWEVKELTSVEVNGENYSMSFDNASSIEAGKPYMVRPSAEVSVINAGAATVKRALIPTAIGDLTFTGTYASGNAPRESFIISNNTFYLVNSDVNLKAFRGYITVAAGGQVKALNYIFDDTEDGIGTLTEAQPRDGEEIYNLAGQRIQKMQRGVNIVNGKKVLF